MKRAKDARVKKSRVDEFQSNRDSCIISIRESPRFERPVRIPEVIKEKEIRIFLPPRLAAAENVIWSMSGRAGDEEFGIGLARATGRPISFPPVSSLSFFVVVSLFPTPRENVRLIFALQIHLRRGFSRFIKFAFFSRRTSSSSAGTFNRHECAPRAREIRFRFPMRKGCMRNFNFTGGLKSQGSFGRQR